MGITTLLWITAFCGSAALSLKRSSWGFIAYLLTVYLNPAFWWFGYPLRGIWTRWNLLAALIFAFVCFIDGRKFPNNWSAKVMPIIGLYFLFCLNATVVHYLFADNVETSAYGLQLSWKQLALLVCMLVSLRDREDLKIFTMGIVCLAGYVAYQIIFEDLGSYQDSRLNSIPIMQAVEANELAGLFCISICLGGFYVFFGETLRTKGIFLFLTCFSLEVVLRAVSRAAFLALFCAAAFFIVSARGVSRRYALFSCVLAIMAALFLMGEQHQEMALSRFSTTFNEAEERDFSADSRLVYWQVGMKMISEHPMGAGYEAAFQSDLGLSYLMQLESSHAVFNKYRAVHNGYLDMTASWGIQGMTFFTIMLVIAFLRIRKGLRHAHDHRDDSSAFFGNCLEAVIVTQLVVCMFSSTLDSEWFLWWAALAVGYEYTSSSPLPFKDVVVRSARPVAENSSATST